MRKHTACLLGAILLFASPAPARAQEITMNFADADIRSVIKFVAEFSHKNFLVDNRVKGKVTVVSPAPIPADAAYEVFLSILAVNGYTTVPAGKVIKIVPLAEAKQQATPVQAGKAKNAGEAVVTQLMPLKHADAQQLVAVLRPLLAPNGYLAAYPPANMLILTDSAGNVQRIKEIVAALDVSEAVGVQLMPLEHASAEKVAQTLNGLYGQGAPARPGTAPATSPVKVIAYSPSNILVVVASGPLLSEIAAVVKQLDVQPKPDAGRLTVRYLKYADAEEVAKVLGDLLGGQAKGQGTAERPLFTGEVKIVPDPATNALLITADASDRSALDAIIDKLDIRRLQVLVEAMIVEVSASTAQQFGIEWRAVGDFTQPGRKPFGGTSFSNQAGTSINTVAANPLATGSGLVVGAVDGTVTFGGVEFTNLAALLRALESVTDANVLSTPNILTMDNEEAEILVGENVPFITGQSSTQGGVTNPFQTIERKDVGITLKVTPQISEGDTVRLQIYQEVSNVTGGTAEQGGFITSKRSVKTVVLANNGQIVVLGGLMRDDNSSTVQRVPCLGSIPLVGEAFKFTENSQRKTNLMVFLRPHIVKRPDDIKTITQKKYLDIQQLYEQGPEGGTILFPREEKKIPAHMNPLATPEQGNASPGKGETKAAP